MRIVRLRAVVCGRHPGRVLVPVFPGSLGLTLAVVAIIADTIYRRRREPDARSV